MDTLNELVSFLQTEIPKLGSIAGLTRVFSNYRGNDWKSYVKFDEGSYNRNRVYCSDEFDVLVISWAHRQFSPLHDHPRKGCIMKVLMGSLEEKLYHKEESGEFNIIATAQRRCGEVGYIDDARGYHSIANTVASTGAVSLHLYSPGNYSPSYLLN